MSEKRIYGQDYSTEPDYWSDQEDEVTPVTSTPRGELVRPLPKPYPADPPKTIIIERVFEAIPGADEKTTGMDRSNALIIRMLPMGCASLFLAFAVAVVVTLNNGGVWGVVSALVVMALSLAYTYNRMDAREYNNSRSGLERHRIDQAAHLKEIELQQAYELRQQALRAYMRHLEVDND